MIPRIVEIVGGCIGIIGGALISIFRVRFAEWGNRQGSVPRITARTAALIAVIWIVVGIGLLLAGLGVIPQHR